jgi:hypothetical protein
LLTVTSTWSALTDGNPDVAKVQPSHDGHALVERQGCAAAPPRMASGSPV